MPTSKRRKPAARPRRLSRTRPPTDLTIPDWQTALRRQFGREQAFSYRNLGGDPVFSEFAVHNPDSGGTYRVAIRGTNPGDNYCACPDFATNLLGTCKHIEFMLGRLERRRGGKSALKRGFEADYSELYLRYGAERHICFRPGRRCSPGLRKRAKALFDTTSGWRLPAERFDRLSEFLDAIRRSRHEVRCYDDALAFVAERQRDQARGTRLNELFPQGAQTPALRDLLAVPLYPYQCEGALFAARTGRGIIADDMGLGKTVQAIAAAEILLRHLDIKRVLVVCPTSLKHQWRDEILRLTGRNALVVNGTQRVRAQQFAQPGEFKITNYDTVRRDLDLLNAWAPDLVIADEAQRIKNWETKAARAMKQIASRYALVLTGTPLENRLSELVSIVQFVDQHRLGPTWRFLDRHQIVADNGRVVGYRHLDEVAATLAPILIRRRKTEVLDQLPPRREKVFLLPLTPPQRALHEEHAETVARIVARWKRQHFLSDRDQKILMAALQSMRMACDSTYLLDPRHDHGTKIPELMRVLETALADPETKAVVFSQWLRSHELLARALEDSGHGYVLFHGGVASRRRGDLVKRFRTDPACRVFLSTDAGGVGLNLQCANVILNLDLPWNPAVLEQRIGRAHRLGQHRPVQVMNFVAEASIEQNLMGLLEFKQSLAAGVLDGGDKEVHLSGGRLARFMETVESATAVPQAKPSARVASPAQTGGRERRAPPTRTARIAESEKLGQVKPRTDVGTDTGSPWQPLLELSQALLVQLANDGEPAQGAGRLVRQDPTTGERYLHLPVPRQETVKRLAGILQELLGK